MNTACVAMTFCDASVCEDESLHSQRATHKQDALLFLFLAHVVTCPPVICITRVHEALKNA